MGIDTSIAISLRDQVTPAINSMRNSNRAFNKDMEETERRVLSLEKRQDSLGDSLAKSQVSLTETANALRDAKKAFSQLTEATDKLTIDSVTADLEKANRQFNQAKQDVKGWGDAISDTRKEIRNLFDEQSRLENRADFGNLMKAGLGKMVGDSAAQLANVSIGSAFGDAVGSALSATLSGAVSGAAMGMAVGGAPGAIVGALTGTVAGGISAYSNYFTDIDEAHKSVRNELVDNALQRQQNDVSSSIDIAMQRQKTGVQLQHQFGDENRANAFLNETIDLANNTPFFYRNLIGIGSTYKSFGYSNDELYEEQLRIANAAAIRGWDASEMESVASTIGFARQSGKLDTQRVKQLQMKGLNIPWYLAIAGSQGLLDGSVDLDNLTEEEIAERREEVRKLMSATDEELKAAGVSLSEDDIYDLIGSGKIDGKKAARAISDYMSIEFEGGAEKLAETYYGLQAQLGGLEEQMLASMGEGYTTEREMMEAVMGGDIGALSMELYFSEDEGKQNELRERLQKYGEEYQTAIAEENGALAGKILAEARIEAQMAYNASEGAKLEQEMHRGLVRDVTDALISDDTYWNAGYLLGEELSKGLASAYSRELQETLASTIYYDNSQPSMQTLPTKPGKSRAMGEYSIPYDDYPILAHQGEMLLTAAQARDYREKSRRSVPSRAMGVPYIPHDNSPLVAHQGERLQTAAEVRSDRGGSPVNVTITGNQFTVREEADIERIARQLVELWRREQMISAF